MIKNKSLKLIITIIIIIFITTYLISYSGYYEYKLQEKTILTNEKIKEFEEDVKNNENIDIKEYLPKEEKDYSNKITNMVYKISNNSNKLAKKCINLLFKKLNHLVEDSQP